MKKEPRQYQRDAANALVKGIKTGVPYASLPTGSGKSLVLSMISDWAVKQGWRVLQLVPTKELCEQNYRELFNYTDNKSDLGVCCAKLGKFEVHKKCVIATTTSFLNRREKSGRYDLLLVDENHLVSAKSDSIYQKIILSLKEKNPGLKIAGVSATPYRMVSGMLHNDSIEGKATFTDLVYEAKISQLISDGYLSHVESISGDIDVNMDGVPLSGTDYNTKQMGVKFDEIIGDAVPDIQAKFKIYGIKTALIFASTLENARRIKELWGGDDMDIVYGDMPNHERAKVIKHIKHDTGNRYVVNVGVLTTGFDFQALDCVVLLRATVSMGLYVQMVGRVIRAHGEKEKGYVIDYGSNIERFGPIDATIPVKPKKRRGEAAQKVCLLCNTLNLLSAKVCKECGAQFVSESTDGKYSMRSKAEILAAKRKEWYYPVADVHYVEAISKTNGCKMVKIKYHSAYQCVHEEYLFLDHPGNIRNKSRLFFMDMFLDKKDYFELIRECEINVDNALELLTYHNEYFRKPTGICISKMPDDRYNRLDRVDYEH